MVLGPIQEVWTEHRIFDEAFNFVLGFERRDFDIDQDELYHNLEESCRVIYTAARSVEFYRQYAMDLYSECQLLVHSYKAWWSINITERGVLDHGISIPKHSSERWEKHEYFLARGLIGREIISRDLKRIRTLLALLNQRQDCGFFRNPEHFPITLQYASDYLLLPRFFVNRTPQRMSKIEARLAWSLEYDQTDLEDAAQELGYVSDAPLHSLPSDAPVAQFEVAQTPLLETRVISPPTPVASFPQGERLGVFSWDRMGLDRDSLRGALAIANGPTDSPDGSNLPGCPILNSSAGEAELSTHLTGPVRSWESHPQILEQL